MPQGSVAWSIIRCKSALISSRFESKSSNWLWPKTLRSVVWAIMEVA